MKLLNLLLITYFFSFVSSSNAFSIGKPKMRDKTVKLSYNNNNNDNNISEANTFGPLQKSRSFFKLIRPVNILPTMFLTFAGGWIINPNLNALLHTPAFIVGIFNTAFIMSTSMILNDLFDIPMDKINNPERPLITGEVRPVEAIGLSVILLGISEYLSFMYFPKNLQIAIDAAIINILLYTPVFKKITLLKNISCAGLIAFSVFFSGLTTATNIISNPFDFNAILTNPHINLLLINAQIIFFGSLYIEILLDMCDVDGDKQNGINTLPVVYGNEMAFQIANGVSCLNILLAFTEISIAYNLNAGLILLFLYSPLLYYLKDIKTHGFTKENIVKNTQKTTIPLFMVLTYFCVLPLIVL